MGEEIYCNDTDEEPCEDSTEALLQKYDMKNKQKTEDITAMQAVICILLTAAFLVLNMTSPEVSKPLFLHLKELAAEKTEVIPNIIDWIIGICSEL